VRTAVVIPTYNEAQNVSALIGQIRAAHPALDILIVDDSSPDGTGALVDAIAAADPSVRIIHRDGPRGYGHASREGLAWCIEHGYEAVASMDADHSHDPAALPELVAQVAAGADLVIGSRFVDGGRLVVGWGPLRRALSRSGSAYARLMLGTKVRDCTSGYRCYKASSLAAVPFDRIDSEGYCFLIELLAMMIRGGLTIAEVPITYTDRRAGSSKISRWIILEAFVRATGLGIRRVFGRGGAG
jgi:dolichol-phosphate mannosyltransferase